MRPPHRSRASRIVTRLPARASSRAVIKPAAPAPTTTNSVRCRVAAVIIKTSLESCPMRQGICVPSTAMAFWTAGRASMRAMIHDAGYFGGVDTITFYPGSDGEQVRIADRVPVTHDPRALQELMFDQLKAFLHVRRHFALHCLDRCSVVRPPGAPHAVCMRDMNRRTKVTVELL